MTASEFPDMARVLDSFRQEIKTHELHTSVASTSNVIVPLTKHDDDCPFYWKVIFSKPSDKTFQDAISEAEINIAKATSIEAQINVLIDEMEASINEENNEK